MWQVNPVWKYGSPLKSTKRNYVDKACKYMVCGISEHGGGLVIDFVKSITLNGGEVAVDCNWLTSEHKSRALYWQRFCCDFMIQKLFIKWTVKLRQWTDALTWVFLHTRLLDPSPSIWTWSNEIIDGQALCVSQYYRYWTNCVKLHGT